MKKFIGCLICMSLLISAMHIKVIASDTQNINVADRNLEQITKANCEKIIIDLIYAIVNNDTEFLMNNSDLISYDCYNKMYDFVKTNNIDSNNLSNFVIDFTYPDNSSTGDSVIMVNTLIWYDTQSYNLAYLFEFHINASGDIYGYNIWVY